MNRLGKNLGDEMPHDLCHQFGFDRSAIIERLNLLGLGGPAVPMIAAELQSHVIQPHVDSIIEDFYDALEPTAEFQTLVRGRDQINRLKMTQRKYLLSLGRDFDSLDYFESRLRVGTAHERAGVSLSLYQSFYCQLQNMLLSLVPCEIRQKPDAFAELAQFIIKITSLDMSLAIETYHSTQVHDLEDSITFCREDTAQTGQPPGLRRISKLSGVPTKELYQLFPKGPGILASKLAGHGKPQGCV